MSGEASGNACSPGSSIVIGGGIAGLAAARRLSQVLPGEQVTLIEAERRLGGKILTDRSSAFVIEGGPDSFLASKPRGIDLCRELGLEGRLQGTDEKQRRTYVLHQDMLHRLPEGLSGLIPARLEPVLQSDLFSAEGKRRFVEEREIPPRMDEGDESLSSFVQRRFGREVYERLIEPLMAGIYAGDGNALSLAATFPQLREQERRFGSVLRGLESAREEAERSPAPAAPVRSAFLSPVDGMESIVTAMARRLDGVNLRTGVAARSITTRGVGYRVTMLDGTAYDARHIIVAVPAHAAAVLLEDLDPSIASTLTTIPYVSTVTVSAAFCLSDIPRPLDGHGYIVPRAEGRPVLAGTWVSSKWRHRAPPGYGLLRVFLGRAGDDQYIGATDDQLLALAADEWRQMLGITAAPVLTRIFRWPRAMAQYNLGHLETLGALDALMAKHSGLVLAGHAYRGVGIPDCIVSGERAVDTLLIR